MISQEAIQRLIQDIRGRNVVEGIQLAQLHFPNSALSWADGSDDKKQILVIDEYAITFENNSVSIGWAKDLKSKPVEVEQPAPETKPKKKAKTKQPLIS